jgi:hypothetical protein
MQEAGVLDGLNFEALNLNDDIKKLQARFTPQEKLIFHLRYLMTTRFEDSFEIILRLVTTFVNQVGRNFIHWSGREVL